jgi:hypothetical protein
MAAQPGNRAALACGAVGETTAGDRRLGWVIASDLDAARRLVIAVRQFVRANTFLLTGVKWSQVQGLSPRLSVLSRDRRTPGSSWGTFGTHLGPTRHARSRTICVFLLVIRDHRDPTKCQS